MKHRNGQIETAGDSFVEFDPWQWKQHNEEEEYSLPYHIYIDNEIKSRLSTGMSPVWKLEIEICRSAVLTVVLYVCKICFVISREEHRLRVFENTVLRIIFGPKKEAVTDYCSSNTIRVIKLRVLGWVGHRAWMRDLRNTFGISVGKPWGLRLVGRLL
jgi:hypothetical protein